MSIEHQRYICSQLLQNSTQYLHKATIIADPLCIYPHVSGNTLNV
jgi:hypothetical protein